MTHYISNYDFLIASFSLPIVVDNPDKFGIFLTIYIFEFYKWRISKFKTIKLMRIHISFFLTFIHNFFKYLMDIIKIIRSWVVIKTFVSGLVNQNIHLCMHSFLLFQPKHLWNNSTILWCLLSNRNISWFDTSSMW